jgi:hypothetical protein
MIASDATLDLLGIAHRASRYVEFTIIASEQNTRSRLVLGINGIFVMRTLALGNGNIKPEIAVGSRRPSSAW